MSEKNELTAEDYQSLDRLAYAPLTHTVSEVPAPLAPAADIRRDMVQHFDSFITAQRNPDGTIGQLTLRQTETLEKIRAFLASDRQALDVRHR